MAIASDTTMVDETKTQGAAQALNPQTAREPEREAVHLRSATSEDAEALALVGAATFLEAFTWMLPGADILAHCRKLHTAEAYRKYFAAPETRITLAEVAGGAPVGYCMLTAPELPSFDVQPGDIELKRIYLFSRFRSSRTPVLNENGHAISGVSAGQALMEAAVRTAHGMGKQRLLLGTHAGNERAIAFYERNGFAVGGTRTFQVGSQVCSDYIFAKTLR